MFGFWDWVGGRYSMDSAIGLLDDARDRPGRTSARCSAASTRWTSTSATAPFERNLPVLMGLLARLVQRFLRRADGRRAAVRAVPEALPGLPAAAHDGEQRQARDSSTAPPVGCDTGPIYWGEPGTNGQHSFYQLIHQGTRLIPCDFIAFANAAQPARRASRHAARERLRASGGARVRQDRPEQVKAEGTPDWLVPHRVFEGNRPVEHDPARRGSRRRRSASSSRSTSTACSRRARSGASTRSTSGAWSWARCSRSGSFRSSTRRRAAARARQLDQRADPPLPQAQGASLRAAP